MSLVGLLLNSLHKEHEHKQKVSLGFEFVVKSGRGWGQRRAWSPDRIDEGPWSYQPCLEARWIKINYPGLGINHQEWAGQRRQQWEEMWGDLGDTRREWMSRFIEEVMCECRREGGEESEPFTCSLIIYVSCSQWKIINADTQGTTTYSRVCLTKLISVPLCVSLIPSLSL